MMADSACVTTQKGAFNDEPYTKMIAVALLYQMN